MHRVAGQRPRHAIGSRAVDRAAAFLEQNRLLAELAAVIDPGADVPTCPGWTAQQLFRHVGRGDRWAAAIVRSGGPVDTRAVPDGRPPDDGLVGWLRAGPVALVEAVKQGGAERSVWTFTGPQPAGWWIRRRLHESVVHRADAALVAGQEYVLPAELAADGMSEWLGLLAARPAGQGPGPLADGVTLHLHATDDGLGTAGEWLVRGVGGAIEWRHGHGKGDAAVRGPARELLLTAYRRRPPDAVQVLGDERVWRTWLGATDF